MELKITRKGYHIKKEGLKKTEIYDIKKELTVRPITTDEYGINTPVKAFMEENDWLIIPRKYGIDKFGIPSDGIRSKKIDINFLGKLRENQIEPYKTTLDCLRNNKYKSGILCASTGCGKTIIALKLTETISLKTLVVCNKTQLLNQWRNEIEKFLPNTRIGLIQGKIIDVEHKDIVLSMVQSLSLKEYDDSVFKGIGMVIFDEIHHLGSLKFSQILFKLGGTKYILGLSATPNRSDGMDTVFKYHIGDIFHTVRDERKGLPVKILTVKLRGEKYIEHKTNSFRGEIICFTKMLSDLVLYKERNEVIINQIIDLMKEKRTILVLSDRVNHLEILNEMLQERKVVFSFSLFVGKMKKAQLDESMKSSVLLATVQIFSEGISKEALDTLILTTPKKYVTENTDTKKKDGGSLEQITGRIFRKNHTERNPMIVDIFDDFSVFSSQGYSRGRFYRKEFMNAIYSQIHINLDKKDKDIVISSKKEGVFFFNELLV